jgi:hypothetical protein
LLLSAELKTCNFARSDVFSVIYCLDGVGMPRFAAALAVAALFGGGFALAQTDTDIHIQRDTVTQTVLKPPTPPLFRMPQLAHQHCPLDVMVWVDPRSRVYLLPGQRGYAVGTNAAYACKREADAAGIRLAVRLQSPSASLSSGR